MMHRKYKILVIEDNEINRDILDDMLSEEYKMLYAENGKEGMEKLREHYSEIDVVILDIKMPLMDGFDVLEAKAKDPLIADIPVIVATTLEGQRSEIRCLRLGAADFIHKPFVAVIVRLRISNILRLRESNEINRLKTVFVQNISEELRTPMNAIVESSQMLCDEGMEMDGETQRRQYKIINQSSHSMMDMIENMLTHSRLDSNSLTKKIEDVAVNDVCRQAMDKASYCYPEGVNVYFTTDVPDTMCVKTDAKLLAQALENFVTNACKFTTHGEIHMHCTDSEHNNFVTISVTDTGKGIDDEHAESVFSHDTKDDDSIQGLGIGLNLVKRIATKLHCNVFLDTSYTNGARFVFEIPQSGEKKLSIKDLFRLKKGL